MYKKKKTPRILNNITIDKLGHGGVGIGRTEEGKKVLVQGGILPGSIIDVIVTKGKKDFFEGRVHTIHKQSPYAEVEAPCPHYYAPGISQENKDLSSIGCGGCKRQQVSYPKQLLLKADIIEDSFRGIKEKLEYAERRDILASPLQRGYRNKIEYSFGDFKQGETYNSRALGFHKQGHFSQIVNVHECLLTSEIAQKLYRHLKQLCIESELPVYNQFQHKGFFRHLVIREGVNTGQFLVNLSVADNSLDAEGQQKRTDLQELLKNDTLIKEHVTTFLISRNNGLGDAVYNSETVQFPLWGDGYIFEKLELTPSHGGNSIEATFRVSANSFFQTNTHGAEVLFSTAISYLKECEGPLIDLYCGAGTIGISMLKAGIGDSLVGIEIVPDAIIDAQYNAQINGLTNTYFVAGKAESLIHTDETVKQAIETAEVIVVDPPRDGLHKNVITFLNKIKEQRPIKLLYISCNPVTLARDIDLLYPQFTAKILQPVDMFPNTHHIETICLLQ